MTADRALPAILKAGYVTYRKDPFFSPAPKLVYTIHNISYQGRFPEDHWPILSLPRRCYTDDFEFYGQINLTKSAIHSADAITTVSETYAREIQTTDFGFGLQDALQRHQKNLQGILNGVDYQEWRPDTAPTLTAFIIQLTICPVSAGSKPGCAPITSCRMKTMCP